MRRITVTNNLTLDGVMQAPMSADEDTRGGFRDGGWAQAAGADPQIGAEMGAGMATSGGMLFGRRTFQHMAAFWPHQTDGNPFTEHLNNARKFVVTRDPALEVDWQNTTVLTGEAVDTIAALKADGDGDLSILGSGDLVRSLAAAGLIDEYVLVIHPVLLGTGQRMFENVRQDLRLTRSIATDGGYLVAHYVPA